MDSDPNFDIAMREIYTKCAEEHNYRPTRFLQMLGEYGGVETARRLLEPGPPSEGLTRLFELRHPELSVEYLVLQKQWRSLFSDAELGEARRRLGGALPSE